METPGREILENDVAALLAAEARLQAAASVIRDLRAAYHVLHPHGLTIGSLEGCTYSLCNEPRVRAFLTPTEEPK